MPGDENRFFRGDFYSATGLATDIKQKKIETTMRAKAETEKAAAIAGILEQFGVDDITKLEAREINTGGKEEPWREIVGTDKKGQVLLKTKSGGTKDYRPWPTDHSLNFLEYRVAAVKKKRKK